MNFLYWKYEGILDRKRGLYVHPTTHESFSISDAINKGVIRARIISPNETNASTNALSTSNTTPTTTPYHHLVSSNRFEENRSYTITAAIDPRTQKRISLSQAMRDGIIDAKNGTYVNIVTGEAISINKAIELKLVLTDSVSQSDNNNNNSKQQQQQHQRQTSKERARSPRREVSTLNVESVWDVRTRRMVSVSEAMQLGLLDRYTLSYCNPLTQEVLPLNRAHERGYVKGHYTDGPSPTTTNCPTPTRGSINEESYFIIGNFKPEFIFKIVKRHKTISEFLRFDKNYFYFSNFIFLINKDFFEKKFLFS